MKKILVSIFIFFSLNISAQAPSGYYSSAEGKTTDALRTALQSIITNGTIVVGYNGLWAAYAKTDENSSGKIWDMYSNCSFIYNTQKCGNYSGECDCYNREHSSPQSWFNSADPMVSDLFNVLPTDGKVNGERSNYPYGEVGTPTYISGNGSKLGPSSFSDYTGVVFEPVDQYKGDLARTYFYMVVRYAGLCESWANGANVVYSTDNLGFTTYAMNLFLKWSRQDPVSAKEIVRNNNAYSIQNNRNPFIDNPGLEEYIWGNKKGQAFVATTVAPTYLSAPSPGVSINFRNVIYQQTDTASIFIQAANLTDDLTLTLSGTNANYFSLPTTTISKDQAQAGYKLVINYTALELGSNSVQLTISGGGITTTTTTINATGIDSFASLAASNVTSTGFTANWVSSAHATGYTLNVFSLTGDPNAVSKTLLSEDFDNGIPTSWGKSGYTDVATASNVRLGSSSQIGQITTPTLNLSVPTTLLVRARQFGTDTSAKLSVKVNGDSITSFLTTVANQDFTTNIPAKTSTSTISLSVASGSGHRAYVDYVNVSTQGQPQTATPVDGYPKSVGNVINYMVTNLQSDSTYYYTVTPEGNTTSVSGQIKIHTLKSISGIDNQKGNSIFWTATSTGINIQNLPGNCKIIVSDLLGKQFQTIYTKTSEITLNLSQKGIYLLQVLQNQELKTYKIRF